MTLESVNKDIDGVIPGRAATSEKLSESSYRVQDEEESGQLYNYHHNQERNKVRSQYQLLPALHCSISMNVMVV